MGTTQQRRQREIADREQLFLERAGELIAREGLLHLQMAPLAEACEYATGTLYQHFTSKEDLLVALATRRILAYGDRFLKASRLERCSRERMFGLAVADHLFCARNPEHSQLVQYVFTEVVWMNATETRRTAMTEACQPCIAAVELVVKQAVEAGDLDPGSLSPGQLSLGPWALCHGVQSLMQTRGLLESMRINEAGTLLFHHVQALLNGLEWRPLFDLNDRKGLQRLTRELEKEIFDDGS